MPFDSPISRRLSLTFSLPQGGEYYEVDIKALSLGVMFFEAHKIAGVLLPATNEDREIIRGLGTRPVVSIFFESSACKEAGVELGHVLCTVNGLDVFTPAGAAQQVRDAEAPMKLLFYAPSWSGIYQSEGEEAVNVISESTVASKASADEWQTKYAVVDGIICASNEDCRDGRILRTYTSKGDYDRAVLEMNSNRPTSVPFQQYSLEGACTMQHEIGEASTGGTLGHIISLTLDSGECIRFASSSDPSALRRLQKGIRRVINTCNQNDEITASAAVQEERATDQDVGGEIKDEESSGEKSEVVRSTKEDCRRDDLIRKDSKGLLQKMESKRESFLAMLDDWDDDDGKSEVAQ